MTDRLDRGVFHMTYEIFHMSYEIFSLCLTGHLLQQRYTRCRLFFFLTSGIRHLLPASSPISPQPRSHISRARILLVMPVRLPIETVFDHGLREFLLHLYNFNGLDQQAIEIFDRAAVTMTLPSMAVILTGCPSTVLAVLPFSLTTSFAITLPETT